MDCVDVKEFDHAVAKSDGYPFYWTEMTTEMTDTEHRAAPTPTELDDQWAVLTHFLPAGWQEAAWTCGAIRR
ncbi:MAG: hypothetical protein C7B45_01685 [Sulfobacillus acidophilus]|uniref:Uncharacterized protein n=1 Tax=Sulfobacillus acidophilus TaxID=53633 RepID=A0A2T2WNG3_9FIRM|nr:MAG: hypothetical protein C7B45_01685 [Sulfobacillus acidophilus]